ncbi:uncharacterized protein LOC115633777 isoform X2 [Scaptodrosophila lebanonensis]|uniref:Uncharacterized protein LOC115633777 isoform X2 n=1 Tax=Drosophila lebanonensis TaxID=7225 RepID=A0A6J2UFC0_DROLE|nr:uncharacterized protein LOC115633777 isoform X2 [Scaptodrosophila lebanonensis]
MQKFTVFIFQNLKLLQPRQLAYHYCINRYLDKIYEKGRAEENVHFLKKQREQLSSLRTKLIKEKEAIRKRMNILDGEIESIKMKNTKREN